jgi:hypothetical protein
VAAPSAISPVIGGIRQRQFSLVALRDVLRQQSPPCLTILMPTHRRPPDNAVDRGTYAGLVDSLCDQLAANGHRHDRDRLTAPLRSLEFDPEFWAHTLDGLAIFAQDGEAECFQVAQPLPLRAIVADRFFTMPLLTLASAIDRFDLLALTSRTARIMSGTSEFLEPVELGPNLHGRPKTTGELHRIDIIDEEQQEPHRVRASSGIDRTLHGGFRGKQDDIDADTERFFREVDRVVFEQVSQTERRPLFLVALGEHAAVFRHLSRNPFVSKSIPRDPSQLTLPELADLVKPFLAEAHRQRVERLIVAYAKAVEHDRGSADPADIARMAVAGRVATLLVEESRFEPGCFDTTTGGIGWGECLGERLSSSSQSVPDLIGRIAEEVLLRGGELVTLPRIAMPNENGLAAIYR